MTKQHHLICLVVLATTVFNPLQGYASGEEKPVAKQQKSGPKPETGKTQVHLIPYVPPKPPQPTPKIRTSQGGTRGCGGLPEVTLLAPEHVALTTQEQPHLYWHISTITHKPMVFTLSSEDAVQPLLELRLPEPAKPGVHFISLAAHKVRLRIGGLYEWSIRMLCEPGKGRSGDLVVKSYIKRVPRKNQPISMKISDDPLIRARGYAYNGIWYDAVTTLHQAWRNRPDNQPLKSAWQDLLEQVDLPHT